MVSRWCLGGVLMVSRWCFGGVSVANGVGGPLFSLMP